MDPKYDKAYPGGFQDPVVRCDSCNKIVLVRYLKEDGGCTKCGNRKVKNLMGFSFLEYLKMRFLWRVDKAFLDLFNAKLHHLPMENKIDPTQRVFPPGGTN